MDDQVNLNRLNGPSQVKNFSSAQQIINAANFPPHTPHRFSVNANYGNSTKEINHLKQQPGIKKSHNFYPNSNSQAHSVTSTKPELTSSGSINAGKISSMMGTTPGISPITSKHIPAFLQKGQRAPMKGSLFIHDDISKSVKTQGSYNGQYAEPQTPKKHGRTSQLPIFNNQMKNSTLQQNQYSNGNKIPSFLQKGEKKQRKIPYQSEVERPQSSKQTFKNILPVPSLSSSQGSGSALKRFKNQTQITIPQQIDPASNFQPGGSWGKKKDKKIFLSDFEKIKQLGSGKYGQVFLARQKKTNFIFALKVIEKKLLKQQSITEQFIRELKIQTFLNHPHIIKMYGFFDDQNYIYIILEVGTGGQLFKQIKRHQSMPQPKVAGIMRQVCQAISELHSNHIIHRDIKPQNIVLSQGIVKLCDFGWSVYSGQTLRTTFCGTPLYVGPQILKGKQYDQKIDIWSLGVMMYQMLIGQNPFKITKQQQLVKIVKDDIKIPNYVQISQQAKDFLFGCLQKNPDLRYSIRQLINHNFFKKYPEKADKKMNL